MKSKINLIIIFLFLIIFVSIPTISSTSNLFNSKEVMQSSKVIKINSDFVFLQEVNPLISDIFSQDFQAPVQVSPSKEGCTKARKSDVFGSKTKFPFKLKKEQPVIHPTLEETNVMRIENEMKKKREEIGIFHMVRQCQKLLIKKN